MKARGGLVLLILLSGSSPARAEGAQTARKHYEQGTTFYDLGRYREAAVEYEQAFALKPEPALLFNIAQAYRLGGDYAAALRSYKSYLRRQPQASNRSEVSTHITKLEKLLEEQKQASTSPPTGTIPVGPSEPLKPAPPPEPAPVAAPAPVVTEVKAAPAAHVPAYKRWWVWTLVGVGVAAGVGVGLGVGLTQPQDVPIPNGTHTVQFP